jgi:hypothetical protein
MFILGHNVVLYNQLVSRMADVVRERIAANKKAEVSGRVSVVEIVSQCWEKKSVPYLG